VTISLVDEHGVRHEVDFPLRTYCRQWIITSTDPVQGASGCAERRIMVHTALPLHALAEGRIEGSEVPFGPSDEPITCIQCLASR